MIDWLNVIFFNLQYSLNFPHFRGKQTGKKEEEEEDQTFGLQF